MEKKTGFPIAATSTQYELEHADASKRGRTGKNNRNTVLFERLRQSASQAAVFIILCLPLAAKV